MPKKDEDDNDKGKGEPVSLPQKWWEKRDPLDWIGAISASLASISVLIAATIFISDRLLPIDLEIGMPRVVEFRCSTMRFDADRCFRKSRRYETQLTVSAALRLQAKGPAVQNVTMETASVTVTSPEDEKPRLLTAFWSGDLTGGKGNFEQVTARSIQGGRTYTREFWFFPLPGTVSLPGIVKDYNTPERKDFKPWFQFIQDVNNIVNRSKKNKKIDRLNLEFVFNWRTNDNAVDNYNEAKYSCYVDIGLTAERMVREPDYGPDTRLYFTLPLNCKKQQTGFWQRILTCLF